MVFPAAGLASARRACPGFWLDLSALTRSQYHHCRGRDVGHNLDRPVGPALLLRGERLRNLHRPHCVSDLIGWTVHQRDGSGGRHSVDHYGIHLRLIRPDEASLRQR